MNRLAIEKAVTYWIAQDGPVSEKPDWNCVSYVATQVGHKLSAKEASYIYDCWMRARKP